MYFATIQQFVKTLKNLDAILQKAQHHAEAKKFDPSNFCAMRLAPDMFPLVRQVQTACDMAKAAAAALAGKEAVKFEDVEKSLGELRTRINSVIAHLESYKRDDFKHLEPNSTIRLAYPPGKGMRAEEAVLTRYLPNFFFHVVTTYDILRTSGVDLGKSDFLGQLNVFDA